MKNSVSSLGALAALSLFATLAPACAVAPAPSAEGSDEPAATAQEGSELFGLAAPTCPTAKDFAPGEAPSLWYWRTRREISIDVFASDGAEVAGVEHVYEVMKSWDPLDGRGITTRRPCHRAFVQRLDGTGRRFLDGTPNVGEAHVTAYMRASGYAIVAVTHEGAKGTSDQVRLDTTSGVRRVLASQLPGACAAASVAIPSPSGDRIALVTTQPKCNATPASWTASVSLLDAKGAPQVGPATRAFAGAPDATYRPDGALVVTDFTDAFVFAAPGRFTAAPVPKCASPRTTSSGFDAQGRQIDAVGPAGDVILGTPTEQKFGCQI